MVSFTDQGTCMCLVKRTFRGAKDRDYCEHECLKL